MGSHSGELNTSATYFSSFANVNSTNKHTVRGTIGGRQQTWQPWDYDRQLKVAEKVDKYRIYPRIGRTFFPGKMGLKLGVRPIRGYKRFDTSLQEARRTLKVNKEAMLQNLLLKTNHGKNLCLH